MQVYALLTVVWPDVALLGVAVAKVAAYALLIAGAVAVVAFLPVELFVGLGIVGVYAVATYPRQGWAICQNCGIGYDPTKGRHTCPNGVAK